MVFAILVATICYPVNVVHASPQPGIKNIVVTRLIDEPTTKKTLFVITTEEDTYHIIVDANITAVDNETLIDLSATPYDPLDETITASAQIPDTLTGAPFYNGSVQALRIHLDKSAVDLLTPVLAALTFVAFLLEAAIIVGMIAVAPVLVALKLLFDGGFFIYASLPWVLLTLFQDATTDGIDLYFPYSPLSVLNNLIFNYEIYYIRTNNNQWWKISEHDVYVTILIWTVELFDYYLAERVYVSPPPIIDPIARFVWTPDQPLATENVTFDGSLSYAPSGYITTYHWSLEDGDLATGESCIHSYDNPGDYDVTLTVTDNNSRTNTTTHTVNVKPLEPVLRVVPNYLQVRVIAGRSATASFYVGETVNQADLLSVNFVAHDFSKILGSETLASGNVAFDKNGITVPKGTWANVTVTFSAPWDSSEGWYSGNITVTSVNDGNSTIFVDLIVYGPPIANFTWSPLVPRVGELVTFDASSSIPDGQPIVDCEWNFGDGQTASGLTVVHTYTSATTYLVTLNVTDSNNLWNTTQRQVQVVQPHAPKADFTVNPETANVGQLVSFDASASQSGWNGTNQMPITKYSWNFGDGNKTDTTTPIIYHAFSGSGIYYPSLTVNASGATPETDAITHRVVIMSVPVGGYSISLTRHNTSMPSSVYLALLIMLSAVFTTVRRKKQKAYRI